MPYDAESWLSPDVRPAPSPIHDIGLFAMAPIREGEVVMRFGGRVIDDTTLASLVPPYSSLTVDEGVHLLLDPGHPVRYGNHSCDPNLWHRAATVVVARRNITSGEEVTIDYATHTGVETWSMECRCGAAICRGTVSGADWRLPALRSAYASHWTPPLLARVAREQGGPGD
ncbi:hypothetical protein SAMN05421874_11044 [Nonomuraea maritima]|uniref:SET domain-containing protein n=1 Tax=Nonomuraea maritima TaxID=683260 RepID=A0A1G9DXG5_9ACTN|nr:SET domain-containing protein-lysine N-methyltransferase [Nonomuraea maritima]SDK68543.1 hypothetical protein SAMN05421874_11044 [Nonomuraea maritima]